MKALARFLCVLSLTAFCVACGGGSGSGATSAPPPPPPPPPPVQGASESGAVYIFTRDAAGDWSQQAYVKASNTDTEDGFGKSVGLSGDTLAVNARWEDSAAAGIDGDQSDNSASLAGAVYVFTRNAAGAWSQQAYIKASNTEAGDEFARLALSDDTLAVGATGEDSAATGIDGDQSDNSASLAGAVYVFTRDAAGAWSQRAYIKASNTDADDTFGHEVALSGDTLAVGAPREDSAATGIDGDQSDNSLDGAGAVYVFTRDAAGFWSQQAYIKSSNPDAGDAFGSQVRLFGDTLAVGAPNEDSAATGIDGDQSDNTADGSGAVYIFTRDAAGVWSQQAYIKASNPDAGDAFGIGQIALEGDRLGVVAFREDSAATGVDGDQSDNSLRDSGAAYLFTRDSFGFWSQNAYFKASNSAFRNEFGTQIGLSGNTLVVNSRLEDSAATGINGDQGGTGAVASGAIYVFTQDGIGLWSQQAYIKASNTDSNDEFGSRVAISGETVAVGASGEDSAATGIDGDQGNTGFGGTVVAVHAFNGKLSLDLGNDSAAINSESMDVISVAVLGSVSFDATQIDFSTAKYGPGKASPIRDGHVEDINNDGIFDMVLQFNTEDTGIACEDTRVRLSGETFGGNAFTGSDLVKTIECQ